MIKEKRKKKKREITFKDEMAAYIKTAGLSFLLAAFFTVLMSFHARSEMTKNLYSTKKEKIKRK